MRPCGGEHLNPRQAEAVHSFIWPGAGVECAIWDEGGLHDGFLSAGGQICGSG